jgi:glycosyltransferase involved in cell wall biosynthesis
MYERVSRVSILVSVIIPAYNAEKYISASIQSVLDQSISDYEIIVINDGSTDKTLNLLKKFKHHIHVIDQENGGVSTARNAGIAYSTGKYIAFLDADDTWHLNKLEIQLQFMDGNSDWVASYTGLIAAGREEFKPITHANSVNVCSKSLKDIFLMPYLGTSSFVIDGEFCRSGGGFNESLDTAEDVDIYLRTAANGLVGHVMAGLVSKLDVVGSLGGKISSFNDNLVVIDDFFKDYPQHLSLLAGAQRVMKEKIYRRWGQYLLVDDHPIAAIRVFLLAQKQKFSLGVSILLLKSLAKYFLLSFKRMIN